MANRRKRPWRVIDAYRTRTYATEIAAVKDARRNNAMVSGPNGVCYAFKDGNRLEMNEVERGT